ncbi:hypothetical protein CCM_00027 [Cordyceps militaris CM01]|uniref:Uncharacterized protein n=1 Tax=Cordyceps militaris (strain CM01) TaxID=983644 RepID=G3J6P5_CORMM|nr:uncharacterized protein CCM_00027 [Cordyceps militaris CM01]EGX95373.1 hypothetical protein CCM_00027 [Cordyceps militaris CM01]
MHQPPVVLAPLSPIAFLTHILDTAPTSTTSTTTVLICAARSDFLRAAVTELHDRAHPPSAAPDVLRATLGRVAAARRIRTSFVPSVAHLRAHVSALPPPAVPARLLVYGFLDVHRDAGGWSAQDIGCSAACLVEAARGGLVLMLREPTGWGAEEEEEGKKGAQWPAAYEEQIPLLSTAAERREDGTWDVPCTTARVVLQRWFTFDDS